MSTLMERAGRKAEEIFERRVEPSSPLRGHETMLRIMLAEAYAIGYVEGIEHTRDHIDNLAGEIRDELNE